MTLTVTRSLVLAASLAAGAAFVQPAAAGPRANADGGVSITIQKQPSYLNTRTVARPASPASYDTSAVYQPTFDVRNNLSFQQPNLPRTFSIPGF